MIVLEKNDPVRFKQGPKHGQVKSRYGIQVDKRLGNRESTYIYGGRNEKRRFSRVERLFQTDIHLEARNSDLLTSRYAPAVIQRGSMKGKRVVPAEKSGDLMTGGRALT
jgi:hypothetical protein